MQVEQPRPSDDINAQKAPHLGPDVLSGVRDVLDLAPYAVVVISDHDTIVHANSRSGRIFGCPVSQLVGRLMGTIVPTWSTAWSRQARSGRRGGVLDRPLGAGRRVLAVREGGTPFQAELLLAPLTLPTGSFTTVVVKDVALRQELLCGEEHLALSQRVAQMGSWENDLTTGQVHFSRQLYRILNIEPGSISPQAETVFAQIHPEDLPCLLNEVERARGCGGGFFAQVRLMPRRWAVGHVVPERFADGVLRMVAVRGSIDLDAAGRPIRTIGTVQGVTARVTLERALDVSDRRFRAAFDQAPIGASLPCTTSDLTRLPEADQRQLHEAFHLQVRYNRATNPVTLRVTISPATVDGLAAVVHAAVG
jgi:PAS domain-containing protein